MNIVGKAIVEGKKLVNTVTEKVSPVVEDTVKTVKEQSVIATAKAKRAVEISVLKAEIDDLYKEFGKAAFEWGLMPDNEKALELMKVLYAKTDELGKLEDEVKREEDEAKEAYIESLLRYESKWDKKVNKEDTSEDKEVSKDEETSKSEEDKENRG